MLACLQRGSPFGSSLLQEFWDTDKIWRNPHILTQTLFSTHFNAFFFPCSSIDTFLYQCIIYIMVKYNISLLRTFSHWTPRKKYFKDAHSLGALNSQQYLSGANGSRLQSLQSCDGGQNPAESKPVCGYLNLDRI